MRTMHSHSKGVKLLAKLQRLFNKNDTYKEMVVARSPSCQDILKSCLSHATKCFNDSSTISRIERLSYVQYIICVMELLLDSTDEYYTISMKFATLALRNISNIPMLWEPIILDLTTMKILYAVNAHYCSAVILNTIVNSIDRMILSIESEAIKCKRLLLQELGRVSIQASEIAAVLCTLKNLSMPCAADSFRYEFKVVTRGDRTVPSQLHFLLDVFSFFRCHPPRLFTAVNTPLVEKVSLPLSDIIAKSTDPICQICHINLDEADGVSVLPTCNHVCCRTCQKYWFVSLSEKNLPWRCATCKQGTSESGTAHRDGSKMINKSCEKLGTYVSFMIQDGAEDCSNPHHFGHDPYWPNFRDG